MADFFLGRWRIIEMEQWDSDYIDLIVPGYFEFGDDRLGYFQFGAVERNIDYRIESFGGEELIAFTFEGADEGDPTFFALLCAAGTAQHWTRRGIWTNKTKESKTFWGQIMSAAYKMP